MTKPTKTYIEMLKEDLLAVAQRLGLTNLNRLRKEEIIDLIIRASAKKDRLAKRSKAVPKKGAPQPTETTAKKVQDVGLAKESMRKKEVTLKVSSISKRMDKPGKSPPPPQSPIEPELPDRNTMRPKVAQEPPHPSPLGPVSAQADAVASKYAAGTLGPAEELQAVDEGLSDLPENYGDNRIVLLPRDLSWLFAYWDLTHEYKEAARAAGGSVFALRLYDVTGIDFDGTNAHAIYEHECAEWARSWYLPTPTPNRDFIVEIGYRGGDQWFPLARSNKVSVPSDQPSTWIKDDFITIRFEEDLREIRDRLHPEKELAADNSLSPMFPPAYTLFDDGELRIVVGGTFLPPSGVPSWPIFSGAEQVMGGVPINIPGSLAFVPGSQALLPSSQVFVAGSIAFVPGSQAFVPGSQAFVPGSQAFVPGSQAFVPGSIAFFPSSLFQLPSSPGFARSLQSLGAPGQLGPQTPAGSFSSTTDPNQYTSNESAPAEPPLLLANVEMVISGRSLPGTELKIADRPIPLGPDGCFSLRVTVPEGLRELPIEARCLSSNATRRIKVRLGRESE